MRVAYVSLQAVEEGQDSWAAVMEIINGWKKDGWDVDLWAPDYSGSNRPSVLRRVKEMCHVRSEIKKRLLDYDALYVRGHTMAYSLVRYAHKRGIPVFQECNGTYEDLYIAYPQARLARPLFDYMQRWQYRKARAIFCGTKEQEAWLAREAPAVPVVISPNGANDTLFSPQAVTTLKLPTRFALFFGQFAPWQGIEVLIKASKSPSWPEDLPLLFVGDGVCKPAVLEAQEKRPDDVSYLGKLPYEQLPGIIASSTVSFSPQYTLERGEEGFSSLKLYETMSCGVPVIGSDYPGVGDVIRQYGSGLVVTPGDSEELACAVRMVAEDAQLAKAMGENGRRAIEDECSWYQRSRQRRLAIEGDLQ